MVKGGLFFTPKNTKSPPEIKDFEILVKFCLRQSDVMLCIVMLLTLQSSDVMRSFSRAEDTPHARSAHHFRRKHHVPLAEHIVEKTNAFCVSFFTDRAPPVTPTVSDCRARAINVGATRQSHSRLARSQARFRYSLLCAIASSTTNFAAPKRVLSRYADDG